MGYFNIVDEIPRFRAPQHGHYMTHLVIALSLMLTVNIHCYSFTKTFPRHQPRHARTIRLNESEALDQKNHRHDHQIHRSGIIELIQPPPVDPAIMMNSTSDIQTSLNAIILDNLALSQKEEESNDSRRTKQMNKSEELAQITTSTSTTQPTIDLKTSDQMTTLSPTEGDDEIGRLYLQNSNYNEVVTTIPPGEDPIKPVTDSSINIGGISGIQDPSHQIGAANIIPESATLLEVETTTILPDDIFQSDESKTELRKSSSDQRKRKLERDGKTEKPPTTRGDGDTISSPNSSMSRPELSIKNSEDQRARQQSLIDTNLNELLFLVKHLKLANQNNPEALVRGALLHQLEQQTHKYPDRYVGEQLHSLINGPRVSSLSSRSSKDYLKNRSAMQSPEAVPVELLATQETQAKKDLHEMSKPRLEDRAFKLIPVDTPVRVEASSGLNRDETGLRFPLKATRYALVSPYSANFDTGVSLNKMPTIKEVTLEPSLEIAHQSKQKQIDRLRHYHENRVKANKLALSKISQGEQAKKTDGQSLQTNPGVATDMNKLGSQTKQLVNTNKPSDLVRAKTSKQNGLLLSRQSNLSPITSNQPANDATITYNQGERTGMGKRDMHKVLVDSRHPSKQPAEQIDRPKGGTEDVSTKMSLQSTIDTNTINYNQNHLFHQGLTVPPGALPELAISNGERFIKPPVNRLAVNRLSHQQANDDPYKKSLYYTDTKSPPILNQYESQWYTGQTSHGVPFRLKSPTGENHHQVNDRLPNESGQYEDFVYMPYNWNGGSTSISGTSLKLDDELKKTLAIKAMEDPNLAASLLETLTGYDRFHQPQSSLDLSHMEIKKLYSNSLDPQFDHQETYHPVASNANPFPMLPARGSSGLPVSASKPDHQHALRANVNNSGVNLIMTDLADKWALSKMPDLIPIPLAATVPGYLIRLPNGQILAAALTNSFSIQGIQRGPLGAGYKKFLNERIKNLIKPSKLTGGSGMSHVAADSGVYPVSVPVPASFNPSGGSGNSGNGEQFGGWLARSVLGQFGLSKLTQRPNPTRDIVNNRLRGQSNNNRARPTKSASVISSYLSSPSDQDLSSLPLIDPKEPLFSFADESQLTDLASDISLLSPGQYSNPLAGSLSMHPLPLPTHTDATDLMHSASTLALKAKLNQLLSLKSILGDELVHGRRKRISSDDKRSRVLATAPLCQLLLPTSSAQVVSLTKRIYPREKF